MVCPGLGLSVDQVGMRRVIVNGKNRHKAFVLTVTAALCVWEASVGLCVCVSVYLAYTYMYVLHTVYHLT